VSGGVLAVLEQRDGALRKVSHEVVTGARRLGDALGGTVDALVLAAGAVGGGADQLGAFGADKVITLTHAAFARYAPEGYSRAIAEHVRAGGYRAVVFAASATGKDLAPRVAARLGVPLAQDVTDVGVESGAVTVVRPVYAGKALLKLKLAASPALVSLRPNVFTPVQRPKAGVAESAAAAVPGGGGGGGGRVTVREIKAAQAGALDVAEAPIVVSGGRGLKEPANFKILEELAGRVRGGGGGGGVARGGGCGVAAACRPGGPDGQDRQSHALHRRRHLGRDPALGGDAHGESHRRDQQGQGRADLQGGRLRNRRRSV